MGNITNNKRENDTNYTNNEKKVSNIQQLNNTNNSNNRKKTVKGRPNIEGCVGLINLDNTDFINSIIHCLSHTLTFRQYFTSLQYKPYLKNKNTLTKGELTNKFAKLLIDIWSNKSQTIAPKQFIKMLSKYAPQLFINCDGTEFLLYVLNGLNEELSIDKNQTNTSITDLFQYQCKLTTICSTCRQTCVEYNTNTILSLPISGHATTHFIIDVYHTITKVANKPNKPMRHVYKMNKYGKVSDLVKIISDQYTTEPHLVVFYATYNLSVSEKYSPNLPLEKLPNKNVGCYLLKDWRTVFTPEMIIKQKLTCHLARFCHSVQLSNNRERWHKPNSPLFGLPFVMTFINRHTCREIHHYVYQRLYQWVGSQTLAIPPPRLQSVRKITDDINMKEVTLLMLGYFRSNAIFVPEELIPMLCKLYEAEWTDVYSILPYKLRIWKYKYDVYYPEINFDILPEELKICDVTINDAFKFNLKTKRDLKFMIEWTDEAYDVNKSILHGVFCDTKYKKWKKQKHGKPMSTIHGCIDECLDEKVNTDNEKWRCLKCHQIPRMITQQMSLLSLPEILIVKLDRFAEAQKIDIHIEYPIKLLDLSKYIDDNTSGTHLIYDLYAVVLHTGGWMFGHHESMVKMESSDRWYCFNDASVIAASESDVVQSESYLLFYKKNADNKT